MYMHAYTVLWVNRCTHTPPHRQNLAYSIEDTSLQVLVKHSALDTCSMQNLEDPEIHSKGRWVYTGTFCPRAQPQRWRSLLVSDSKAFVKGSQSRAGEPEVICPVAGPPGALVSSPIFKAEFKTPVFECVVLQMVLLVTAPQMEVRVFPRSLSAASHVC